MNKNYLILAVILLLATVLRFWNLANAPPSLTWDEAALGYNAYSILRTGKDEYGNFLPLNLKSFGDYKPAIYAYIDIPFVAILGLNEVSVRSPSAIFGVLSVLVVFLIVRLGFKNERLALFCALALAISPLSLQFSRPAFESSVALTFNLLGGYFFLKGLKRSKWHLLSAGFFGLSLFTYQSSRLFVPLIILSLMFIYRPEIKFDRYLKIGVGSLMLLFGLMLVSVFGLGQSNRLATLNVFAYPRTSEIIDLISKEDKLDQNSLMFQLLHGEWFAHTRGLFERFLLYFSVKMLFVDGDVSFRNRVPDLGLLYYFSAVLIPVGFFGLVRAKTKMSLLLLVWWVLAILPAVLARDLINVIRSFNMVLTLSVLEGFGMYYIFAKLWRYKNIISIPLITGVVLLMLANFLIYLDRYYVHAPIEYSFGWVYGYKALFAYLNDPQVAKYPHVIITDDYGQPYIYYLFYNQYDPAKFQAQASLDQGSIDVGTVRRIDKYEFRRVDRWADRSLHNTLLVAIPLDLAPEEIARESNWTTLKEINFLNGKPAFRIVESR